MEECQCLIVVIDVVLSSLLSQCPGKSVKLSVTWIQSLRGSSQVKSTSQPAAPKIPLEGIVRNFSSVQ